LENTKKCNLPAFNEHTAYLLGDEYYCEGVNKFAVFSTENMLLNAYRQSCYGQDMLLSVDTSYRYTNEDFALLPVFNVSPDQTGHRIAYALLNKESAVAHEVAFRIIKAEVEKVVAARRNAGDTFC
jgi:hypothetical protein